MQNLRDGGRLESVRADSGSGLEERLIETYKSRSFVPGDKMGSY